MQFSVLGSGSGGNSVFIESAGSAILIDAGFSGKEVCARLAQVDRDMERVQAICVTHEHRDHVSGVGVLARKYSHLNVWGNEGTIRGSERITKKIDNAQEFETGDYISIGDLELRSFSTLHDTSDPVGYIVSDGTFTLGYCTDTGHVSHLMAQRLAECDALILEFNHDPDLLRMGPYPLQLQQRVRSRHGHLCNEDSAVLLESLCHDKLQSVVLAHLSETNNTPDHALRAAQPVCEKWPGLVLSVAHQDKALPLQKLK